MEIELTSCEMEIELTSCEMEIAVFSGAAKPNVTKFGERTKGLRLRTPMEIKWDKK